MTDSLFYTISNDPALMPGQRQTLLALIRDGKAEDARKLYELWTGKELK